MSLAFERSRFNTESTNLAYVKQYLLHFTLRFNSCTYSLLILDLFSNFAVTITQNETHKSPSNQKGAIISPFFLCHQNFCINKFVFLMISYPIIRILMNEVGEGQKSSHQNDANLKKNLQCTLPKQLFAGFFKNDSRNTEISVFQNDPRCNSVGMRLLTIQASSIPHFCLSLKVQ
ncbi:hypothetical protein EGR_01140 [Echinococcus granulosus]|uniref:Uncharacterized protein n=1 Tax=Echinococcus granulosus TaxID=6210 RepID=W6UZQ3_ECHGR|nr:hypothetical protein EGR_01140 [Echinococcus granulosus]EUB64012.1 hypothetical protein EGR_01140 [Echinococcus granulosus]